MDSSEVDEKIIAEEYKIWKKNTPFLYELVMTNALEWPSLTVQWLPDVVTQPSGADYNVHKLMLGTHTAGENEQNHLMIAEVRLPTADNDNEVRFDESDANNSNSEFLATAGKVETVVKINHQGEVHRARYMPQHSNLIATKSPEAEVYVFDTKDAPKVQAAGEFTPTHTCEGHSTEGWAVCWSPHTEARLVSGSDDTDICVWDLKEAGKTAKPLQKFTAHTDVIEDVAWHSKDENLFASVSDDKFIYIWDMRDNSKPAFKKEAAHDKEVLISTHCVFH
jgi:histone-binding protein RBBP4